MRRGVFVVETVPADGRKGTLYVLDTPQQVETLLASLKKSGIKAVGWEM